MTISGLSSIEAMLQQMRAMVRLAEGSNITMKDLVTHSSSGAVGSFAGELQRSLRRISKAENAATQQSKAFELGDPGVSLNNVMIDIQKAGISFQTAVQVRNRLITAYKEISTMAI